MLKHKDHRDRPIRLRSNGPIVGQLKHAAPGGGPKIYAVPVWRIDLGLLALLPAALCLVTAFVFVPSLGWGIGGRIVFQILGTLFMVFAGQAIIANLCVRLGRLTKFESIYITQRLDHGQCGACGYGLSAIPDESDGCRVCPECGAAWLRGSRDNDGPRTEIESGNQA